MAKSKSETKERKKPVRMGSLGDGELASAIQNKLIVLIRPIATRPKFKEVRSVLFAMIGRLSEITNETTNGKPD